MFRYDAFRALAPILFTLLFATTTFAQFQITNYNGAAAVADEIVIRLRSADPAAVTRVRNVLPGANVDPVSEPLALHVVRSPGQSLAALVQAFSNHPDVLYAEPNYVVNAVVTPNDTFFSSLWGMTRIGAPAAWGVTTGGTSAVIGVVDTGVDYTHPDLAANIWSAPSAFSVTIGSSVINCPAGSHGFNALTMTCDPRDDNDHGTHASGTVGATGNNGAGVVGVNWTARIIGLKFLNAAGSGTTLGAIYSIEFARQVKLTFAGTSTPVDVRVLSNSWSGNTFSQSLLDAINMANSDNILFVAAAGNNSSNNDIIPVYPANYSAPNVIAVAATTSSDALAGFSNYGPTKVHLGAPGQVINSTIRGGYAYYSGTSMATPHVAGVALLTLAACPSLNTAGLKNAILSNVDPLPSLQGYTITGGLLNVDKAVRSCASRTTLASSANPAAAGTNVTFTATVSGNNPTGNVSFADGGNTLSGCGAVALSGTGNSRTAACTSGSLTAGTHSIVASYSGDGNNPPSTSAPLAQVISATTTGPTGHWAFDETSGNTASDSSGNNNAGTLINGPVWSSSGKIGGALFFDGVNDYVSLGNPASLIPGTAMTLAGWMNLNNISVSRFIISKYDGVQPQTDTFLRYQGGTGITCSFGGTSIVAAASIVAGQWYHAACTYDGVLIRVYLNGAQIATRTKTGTIADEVGTNWLIGARTPANPGAFMSGLLDDVRIYNRALSATEITQLNSAAGPDTIPPVLGNGGPTGTLPAGTTQTTLTLATNENATCRYSTVAGTAYSAMTNTFSTTGATSHSTPINGLSGGSSYSFFARCRDAAANVNTTDYTISFSVGSGAPPPDIITGLKGHWALDETSGSAASDSSGNNNTGTLINGPVWSPSGRVGGALFFDGVNDYVSLGNPASLIPGNAITLAGWMNLNNLSVSRFMISKYDGIQPQTDTFLRYQGGTGITCSLGGTSVVVTASIVAGQWYHAACTYDGALIRVYLNGVQVATRAKTGVIADEVGTNWLIGARTPANPGAFMSGRLDDIRVYNRALTAAEIGLLSNP